MPAAKKSAPVKKSAIVTFRADPALVERLRVLAEKDGRSLSSYVTRVLQSHVGRGTK